MHPLQTVLESRRKCVGQHQTEIPGEVGRAECAGRATYQSARLISLVSSISLIGSKYSEFRFLVRGLVWFVLFLVWGLFVHYLPIECVTWRVLWLGFVSFLFCGGGGGGGGGLLDRPRTHLQMPSNLCGRRCDSAGLSAKRTSPTEVLLPQQQGNFAPTPYGTFFGLKVSRCSLSILALPRGGHANKTHFPGKVNLVNNTSLKNGRKGDRGLRTPRMRSKIPNENRSNFPQKTASSEIQTCLGHDYVQILDVWSQDRRIHDQMHKKKTVFS